MPTFLSFGEILFDIFSPCEERLGGAPLNFSYHLKSLGWRGKIISSVGHDKRGENALKEIKDLNIDTSYISLSNYPTGISTIKNERGNADYEFNYPSSWDDISLPDIEEKNVDLFYFGTLALRSEKSYSTWKNILFSIKAKNVVFDLNFRKDFYTKELISKGLEKTNILRMNENECKIILKIFYPEEDEKEALESLLKEYNLKLILITLGEEGSTLYDGKKWLKEDSKKIKVCSTVGAGDAFLSAFLNTYIKTGNEERALKDGRELSSFVVTKKSAMPEYSDEIKSYFGIK